VVAEARQRLAQAIRDREASLAAVVAATASRDRAAALLAEAEAGVRAAEHADTTTAAGLASRLEAASKLDDGDLATLVRAGDDLAVARSRLRVAQIAASDRDAEVNRAQRQLAAAKGAVAEAVQVVLLAEAEDLAERIEAAQAALTALHARLGGRYGPCAQRLPKGLSERLQKAFHAVDAGPCGQTGSVARTASVAYGAEWLRLAGELTLDPNAKLEF
jgi:hypothetical protein